MLKAGINGIEKFERWGGEIKYKGPDEIHGGLLYK
jgi:hypothetical protein